MQRPRRTSEIQDDPNYIRRNSRSLQRNNLAPSPAAGSGMAAACTGGTAKKYNTRQSRIAVSLRPSSNDRLSSTKPYLSVPTTTAQRGVTPQKTPLPKTSANRALFTAEKQRHTPVSSSYTVALHNDKKWVHEATERITDHLLNQGTLIGGINTDFLVRGLRQMSIKQFIAIINYFLGYIWGNRFTVGSNHVDDIISIMQKLKYPYPLNKSWLKTPNTQHSFGNVVVLLDFLLEFAPTNLYSSTEEMYFDLEHPKDCNASKIEENHFQIPDVEFQQQLLINTEKGFLLWDKQKIDEFNSLKQETCNILLQKVCNVANFEEMEIEIQKSREILKSLEKERPPEDIEMKKLKTQLSRELKNLNQDLQTLQVKCETNKRNIKELSSRKMMIAEEVKVLEKEVKALQERLSKQSITIEQRDQMIENVMQHKQILAIKERTLQDLQSRYHNEQILKSKAIKQLNDQIEKFNTHMREIKFSDVFKWNDDNLELTLRPQQKDIEKLKTQLEHMNQIALQTISENKKTTFQLQERCKYLKIELDAKLYPKLNSLKSTNTNLTADLQKLIHSFKMEENELLEIIKNLNEDLVAAENTIQELQNLIEEKKLLVENLRQDNEQTMKNAEETHQQRLEQRKAFLKQFDEVLEEFTQSDELQQLTKQVDMQEKLLEEIKKEFL